MGPLGGTRNLFGMSLRWRIGLAAIIAAAVVGGFVPHAALSGAQASGAEVINIVESPLSAPVTCVDAACGKGSPASAAPTPGVALVATVAGLLAIAAAAAGIRRRRAHAAVLPAGSRDPLFHPPKFS